MFFAKRFMDNLTSLNLSFSFTKDLQRYLTSFSFIFPFYKRFIEKHDFILPYLSLLQKDSWRNMTSFTFIHKTYRETWLYFPFPFSFAKRFTEKHNFSLIYPISKNHRSLSLSPIVAVFPFCFVRLAWIYASLYDFARVFQVWLFSSCLLKCMDIIFLLIGITLFSKYLVMHCGFQPPWVSFEPSRRGGRTLN